MKMSFPANELEDVLESDSEFESENDEKEEVGSDESESSSSSPELDGRARRSLFSPRVKKNDIFNPFEQELEWFRRKKRERNTANDTRRTQRRINPNDKLEDILATEFTRGEYTVCCPTEAVVRKGYS
eukprot:UN27956